MHIFSIANNDPDHLGSRAGEGVGRIGLLSREWMLTSLVGVVILVGYWEPGGHSGGTRLIGRSRNPICAVAFSPNNSNVAVLETDGRLTLWDAEGSGRRCVLGGEGQVIRSFAFDPDGDRIAFGDRDGSILLQGLANGAESGTFDSRGETVLALAFSPDGRWLASGDASGRLGLRQVEGGKLLLEVVAHGTTINALAFSPDGCWLASSGADGVVAIRDTGTGKVLDAIAGERGMIRSLAFSPDGKALIWLDHTRRLIRRWDLRSKRNVTNSERQYEELVVTADGSSALARTSEGRLEQLDTMTLRGRHSLQLSGRRVCTMAVSHDGTRIALGGLEVVEIRGLDQPSGQSTMDGRR